MVYSEVQRRGKRKYYYLAHSLRLDSGFRKVRVFLGVNLSEERLKNEIKIKSKLLQQKISVIEKTEKEEYVMNVDFSKKLMTKVQLEKLEQLKKRFKNKIKLTDKDVLRKVRGSFLVRFTYDTNAAEGNTISLKETDLILSKGIIPKSHTLREVHEIENIVRAYEFIEMHDGKLDHHFILKLHKLVTEKTFENEKNEGRYRSKGQNVIMTGSENFPPKGGRQIKKLVNEIIEKYKKCTLSFIEKTILFHSAFIAVHPFVDGNGRVSRLIFNWMLLRERLPPVDFPSKLHIEYTDLMEVSRKGDSIPLAKYLFDRILHSTYVHNIWL
jgi:Fic family protein